MQKAHIVVHDRRETQLYLLQTLKGKSQLRHLDLAEKHQKDGNVERDNLADTCISEQ